MENKAFGYVIPTGMQSFTPFRLAPVAQKIASNGNPADRLPVKLTFADFTAFWSRCDRFYLCARQFFQRPESFRYSFQAASSVRMHCTLYQVL